MTPTGLSGPPSFIDLFAGCGGLSLGLLSAGWNGSFAVEKDPDAFATLQKNLIDGSRVRQFGWPEWYPKAPRTIASLLTDFEAELKLLRGNIDLMAGGPPCQGFSSLGRRSPGDPRNRLFESYLSAVELIRPRFLIVENVLGIGFSRPEVVGQTEDGEPEHRYSMLLKRGLWTLGYDTYSSTVLASDFGVAQTRPRYFVIGVQAGLAGRIGIDPFQLLKGHRRSFLASKGLGEGRIGVSQAISDFESGWAAIRPSSERRNYFEILPGLCRTRYQALLRAPSGEILADSTRMPKHRSRTRERMEQILRQCEPGKKVSASLRMKLGIKKHSIRRLDPDSPAPTLSTLPDDFVHYSEPRVLTVREMARLQSFPDWFSFQGNYTTGERRRVLECPRYTQVGNAVAPFVAEAIGQMLLGVLHRVRTGPTDKFTPPTKLGASVLPALIAREP